jgi:micrococcal nuclease
VRAIRLLVLAALAAFAATSPVRSPAPVRAPAIAPDAAPVSLVRVIDGDTIVVRVEGRIERVRLIGIDTPERDECYFREATVHLTRMLDDRRLTLERDVSERDRYGRLLRYLYADGRFVNAAMVRDGYALAATFPPDVEHATEFVALQRAARLAARGLWSDAACA